MKKDLYLYMGLSIPKPIDLDSLKDEPVESSDSAKGILQAIYGLDPITKLPTGDIMCYLASSTPPEIKQYILDNIMIDVSSQALPKVPEGVDDDTVFQLQRNKDESVDSYRARINDYMVSQVNIRNMAIENVQRETSKPNE